MQFIHIEIPIISFLSYVSHDKYVTKKQVFSEFIKWEHVQYEIIYVQPVHQTNFNSFKYQTFCQMSKKNSLWKENNDSQ